MSNELLFYICGIVLALSAVVVSFGAVTVDVRGARSMRVRRDVEGHLDVVERVIEMMRRDELAGQAQRTVLAQRSVGRREPVRSEEVEVRSHGPRRSR